MEISPENWEAVKALFQAAQELAPEEIAAFLNRNCADPSLRAEVERLLTEDRKAGNFLSAPALLGFRLNPGLGSEQFRPGELLAGRFKVIRFIAAGGMGAVYEAEDIELKTDRAIKVIRPEILNQSNAVARFRREVRLAQQVTHPNVCRVFDIFRHKSEGNGINDLWLVSMELLQGGTLADRLRGKGRMSLSEALPLINQMASALSAAHRAGIVHRDFKPGNVMLVASEDNASVRAVVTDFGLAVRSVSSAETTSLVTGNELFGSPAYMAPEQIEGRIATPASDIYALGLVMYEMVAGRRPFEGDTPISMAVKRLSQNARSPRDFRPELSPQWETTILRCLERQPAKRFTSTQEIADALSGQDVPMPLAPTVGPTVEPPNSVEFDRFETPKSHRLPLWAGVAALVFASMIAAFWLYRSRSSPPQTVQFPTKSDLHSGDLGTSVPQNGDTTYWQSINPTDPAELQQYLLEYPNGEYADLARTRLKKLTTEKGHQNNGSNITTQTEGRNLRGCNGMPASRYLSLTITSLDLNTGVAYIGGVDRLRPTAMPFTWNWGDGRITQGWFPQSHVYADTKSNYVLQVTSHENDGSTECAWLLIPPDEIRFSEATREIKVPGSQPWTDTGVDLRAGDTLSISASGNVRFSAEIPSVGPGGDQPKCGTNPRAAYIAPELRCHSLIGRIGLSGAIFEVGVSRRFRASATGRLYLGVNDNFFPDNSGNWTVHIAPGSRNTPSSNAGQPLSIIPERTLESDRLYPWIAYSPDGRLLASICDRPVDIIHPRPSVIEIH
ncbi:MAG: serine/threonine-protein kinase [Terriglobales bacterium]|jgi:serine/threonine protein kinase